jgi:PAS domain S-box-containing protein
LRLHVSLSRNPYQRQDGKTMQWKMERRLIGWGFVAATIILVFAGWESYRNTTRFAEAADWQKHTYEVLRTLDETEARLVDAETGQRGYLLTGDEAYLHPYRTAIKNIYQVTGHLRDLTSDNPNQQKRILTLEPLIEKKLTELQSTIDLRKQGLIEAANQVVLLGSGEQSMDQIRSLVGDMAIEENDLLRIRTQRANEGIATSTRAIAIGTLVSILLLLSCFGLLSCELTERNRAQVALAKSEKWSSTTLGSIGDAVIAADMNGAVTFMNSVAESLTGWNLQEAQGKSIDLVLEIVNEETRRPVENPVKKVFREGKVVGLADHTLLISKKGKEFDIEDSAAPIVTAAGENLGVVLVFRDITELKKTREELERFFTLSIDMICIAGYDGHFKRLNPAWQRILGYSAQELIARPYLEFVHPEDREATIQRTEKFKTSGDTVAFTNRYLCKDGSYKWLMWNATPFAEQQLIYAVARDITQFKHMQEGLVSAKEEAERSNKFKDQFLSTMSHELRTPLNAVMGFSDMLSEERYGPLNDRQRRYVTHINTGGRHLLRLINDILDLSKIEAGRLQLAIESVPVNPSFAEVFDCLRPLADKKSQTLAVHSLLDLSVRADATRFRQVLMNLVGNAIKFTPDGGKIELAAQQLGEVVRVEVRDSGPGIPAEEQQRIFEAFHRLRQSDKMSEGTGLGLAITRRLVELHGGRLGLESKHGSGSCFYFTLPIAPTLQKEERRKAKPGSNPSGLPRILVIEDESAAAQLLHSQLVSSGYEVLLCDNRARAVEMAVELQPDAITLDIMMKPVNGWELLSELKSDVRTAKIPVIVVTAVDQPATGALLGADEYIVKPVEKATLLAAVERCLNLRGQMGRGRPILVVDDDTPTREFIAELLSKHGYVVTTAADGFEARAQVSASLPELVILDLIMPNLSGFQLLAEWRGDSRTADLPVFVLTSKDLSAAEKEYLRTNTGAFFCKQERWQDALIRQLQRAVPPVLAGKS